MTAPIHIALAALKSAAKGLLFISETEAELQPFLWDFDGPINGEQVLRHADYEYEEGTPVEAMTLEEFFRAAPIEYKEKFDQLAAVLKQHVSDVQVYKVGAVEKDVYIVGRTSDGKCAGLITNVVET